VCCLNRAELQIPDIFSANKVATLCSVDRLHNTCYNYSTEIMQVTDWQKYFPPGPHFGQPWSISSPVLTLIFPLLLYLLRSSCSFPYSPSCLSSFMFLRFVTPFRTYSVITRIFSPVRVQLKSDGTRWRTGGEVKGKNGVGSQYPSHYLGTWIFRKWDEGLWTGSNWLRIGTVWRALVNAVMNLRVP